MKKRHFCSTATAVYFCVHIVDILIAKVKVLRGENIPVHLGDTLQFLVLLLAVTFFVIGTLGQEKARDERDKPKNNQECPLPFTLKIGDLPSAALRLSNRIYQYKNRNPVISWAAK